MKKNNKKNILLSLVLIMPYYQIYASYNTYNQNYQGGSYGGGAGYLSPFGANNGNNQYGNQYNPQYTAQSYPQQNYGSGYYQPQAPASQATAVSADDSSYTQAAVVTADTSNSNNGSDNSGGDDSGSSLLNIGLMGGVGYGIYRGLSALINGIRNKYNNRGKPTQESTRDAQNAMTQLRLATEQKIKSIEKLKANINNSKDINEQDKKFLIEALDKKIETHRKNLDLVNQILTKARDGEMIAPNEVKNIEQEININKQDIKVIENEVKGSGFSIDEADRAKTMKVNLENAKKLAKKSPEQERDLEQPHPQSEHSNAEGGTTYTRLSPEKGYHDMHFKY